MRRCPFFFSVLTESAYSKFVVFKVHPSSSVLNRSRAQQRRRQREAHASVASRAQEVQRQRRQREAANRLSPPDDTSIVDPAAPDASTSARTVTAVSQNHGSPSTHPYSSSARQNRRPRRVRQVSSRDSLLLDMAYIFLPVAVSRGTYVTRRHRGCCALLGNVVSPMLLLSSFALDCGEKSNFVYCSSCLRRML